MIFSYLIVGKLIKEGKSHDWQIAKPRRACLAADRVSEL